MSYIAYTDVTAAEVIDIVINCVNARSDSFLSNTLNENPLTQQIG